MPTRQLRIYTLEPDQLAAFVEAWRDGVVPLRERFGFRVDGAWVAADGRFAWIVAHDGDFAAADQAYYASDERARLNPDPASWVISADTVMIEPITG